MMNLPGLDCFCGAGGWAEALNQMEVPANVYVKVAINHDKKALEANRRNHPGTIHINDDICEVNPYALAGQHPDIEWLSWSAECTNFSIAKGGDSRDPDSRMLSERIFPFIDAFRFKFIFIENVREFMTWGPMREKVGKDGKVKINKKTKRPILEPDPAKKGAFYFSWVNRIQDMGYAFD
jgi:DNA (cytosine-5)-methyltransferase 1